MTKRQKKVYAPHQRNFMEQKPTKIKAYSQKDYTELPDPIRDPIAVNNIANMEFDYTYDGEDDIFVDNDYFDYDKEF